jgi:hypothetical protein
MGVICKRMALGLTRKIRVVAGRLLVLSYLFCVLSPAAAIALSDSAQPCLDEISAPVALSHHDVTDGAMMPQMHAAHAHHHHADAIDGNVQTQHVPAPVPAHHDHSKMPGPCCAMMCAVGLTAVLPAVTLPSPLATASEAVRETSLPGRTPARLYRPPIVLI